MALGIPDELYWRCTNEELKALVIALQDRDRHRYEAAVLAGGGLAAAATYNVFAGKGKRWGAADFLPPRPVKEISGEQAYVLLRAWADAHNKRNRA